MSMMYVRNLVDLHLKYYTDYHDVDEDLRTLVPQGGSWWEHVGIGVAFRRMIDTPSPTDVHDDVAYKFNKNSTLITGVEFYMNCLNLWICQITKEQCVIVFIVY